MKFCHLVKVNSHFILWQQNHYQYEIENKRSKEIVARPESFAAACFAFENLSKAAGVQQAA